MRKSPLASIAAALTLVGADTAAPEKKPRKPRAKKVAAVETPEQLPAPPAEIVLERYVEPELSAASQEKLAAAEAKRQRRMQRNLRNAGLAA